MPFEFITRRSAVQFCITLQNWSSDKASDNAVWSSFLIAFFMKGITSKIKNVHFKVHFLTIRKKYTIAYYTGGVKLSDWNTLSKEKQKTALSKDWYIRWSYRGPETHKLVRQNNIKGGINYYKTKSERLQFLNTLKHNLELLLEGGYSPFSKEIEYFSSEKQYSANEALDFILNLKKS